MIVWVSFPDFSPHHQWVRLLVLQRNQLPLPNPPLEPEAGFWRTQGRFQLQAFFGGGGLNPKNVPDLFLVGG